MNIYDTTTEVGISISTVLRVLNNKENVNPKVRDRVEAVLKRYDCRPSVIARGMVSETIRNTAILTADMWVTHHTRMIYVIEQEFSNLGYNVSVCNTGGSTQECNRYFEILSKKQTDGIVLIGPIFDELIKYPKITAKIRGTPIITANGQVKLPDFYLVLIDNTKVIRMASDYMSDHGRMDLFYVSDIATDGGRAKRQGFLEAMRLRDMPGGNNRVPGDVAATGCSNLLGSRICEPEPTTLDNKPELLDGVRVFLLRDRMEGKESATSVATQPELVVRGSKSF